MKGQIGQLMQQAKRMQEDMQRAQEELARLEVTGNAGAGLVSVVMSGAHEVRRVQIDLVMVTSGGYYAFAVERRPNVGGALFAALMAILLVILGARAWQRAHSSAN